MYIAKPFIYLANEPVTFLHELLENEKGNALTGHDHESPEITSIDHIKILEISDQLRDTWNKKSDCKKTHFAKHSSLKTNKQQLRASTLHLHFS